MSFANKGRDSKDTAALRKEYEKKAQEFRDSGDAATKAKLKDEKAKLFNRVVSQISAERKAALKEQHKVLAAMGKMKTREQVAAERQAVNAERNERLAREGARL